MPFNFNLAQTGFQPNPNNCCGDYALDAILFDLNVHNPVNVQLLLISFKQSTFEYPVLC